MRTICARIFSHQPVSEQPCVTEFEELCWAIKLDQAPTAVSLILSNPTLVLRNDANGRYPLHYLDVEFNRATYNHLITAGANVNAQDFLGLSLLHRLHEHRAVGILISDGADSELRCNEGLTPLMVAVQDRNRIDIVHALLLHGADLNARTQAGNSIKTLARLANNQSALAVFKSFEQGSTVQDLN